jgi:hypothetical protein
MKKHMTLALAASMLFLTTTAVPHRAMAASDVYLQLDGIKGESTDVSRTPPSQYIVIANAVLTFLGL